MNKISWQEFWMGFLSVSPLIFKFGVYTCWLAVVCGALWAIGGTYNKLFRRLGVPLTVWLMACLGLPSSYWYALVVPAGFLILSIGDSFPDYRPSTKDEGSFLGRIVSTFLTDEQGGGFITKLIIVILFQLALIPIYVS